MELHFAERDELRIPEIFVPAAFFAQHYSEDGSLERDMSEARLRDRGFHVGVRE